MLFGEIVVGTTFVLPINSPAKTDDPNRSNQKCVFEKRGETEALVVNTIFSNHRYLIGRVRHFTDNDVVDLWNL